MEQRNIWNPNLASAMTPVLVPSSGDPPCPLSCCSQQASSRAMNVSEVNQEVTAEFYKVL